MIVRLIALTVFAFTASCGGCGDNGTTTTPPDTDVGDADVGDADVSDADVGPDADVAPDVDADVGPDADVNPDADTTPPTPRSIVFSSPAGGVVSGDQSRMVIQFGGPQPAGTASGDNGTVTVGPGAARP